MRFSLKALFLKRVFEMVLLCSMLGIVLSGIGHAEIVSGSVLASDKTITIDSSAHNSEFGTFGIRIKLCPITGINTPYIGIPIMY